VHRKLPDREAPGHRYAVGLHQMEWRIQDDLFDEEIHRRLCAYAPKHARPICQGLPSRQTESPLLVSRAIESGMSRDPPTSIQTYIDCNGDNSQTSQPAVISKQLT
jgi:hypothetical protein